MKTTVDIPETELNEAIRFTKARTKREAVNVALAEFNRRKRVEEVIKILGTFDSLPSNEEIEAGQTRDQKNRRRHGPG